MHSIRLLVVSRLLIQTHTKQPHHHAPKEIRQTSKVEAEGQSILEHTRTKLKQGWTQRKGWERILDFIIMASDWLTKVGTSTPRLHSTCLV